MCSSIICILIFIICALKTCYSLECYSCGSQLGASATASECEYFSYSWNEKHKQTMCLYSDAVCAKYIVEVDGSRWVHRSCQHYDFCSQLSRRYNNGRNVLLECSTCADENLCNSSSIYSSSLYYSTFLLVVVSFMR